MITIDDLTKNEVEGTGVFDELMRSVKAHLNEEYAEGRITAVNYSSVYLGALQNTMSQAVEFLLNKDKVGITNELIKQQHLNAIKEGTILDLKAEELKIENYNAKYKECLLQNQIAKLQAENERIYQETANAKTQSRVLAKQVTKAQAEIALYKQKAETEKAQIYDKLDGVSIGGTIGRQNEMYRNQSNGYLRLAEQQNARLMMDAYAVLQSNVGIDNMPGTIDDWGITPGSVTEAVGALKDGVKRQLNEHTAKVDFVTGIVTSSNYTEEAPVEPSKPTMCTVTVPNVG